MKRGVYFLANDGILDQAVAFLNSFRAHNPTIPLCLIPFADDTTRLAALADRYQFTVWTNENVLRHCDAISAAFHYGMTMGQYRKLAMWHGPFDEFVYIDTDTVVLESVDFVFPYLDRYDFLASHSNLPHLRQWVWRNSIHLANALSPEQIAYSASTGFLASRAGALDVVQVRAELGKPLALAQHMKLLCVDQPLLNYLIVTSGRPYSSLSAIAESTGDPDIPQEQWAGQDIGRAESGRLIPSRVHRVLLVHWAGEWHRAKVEGGTIPYHDLWQHYRRLADADATAPELEDAELSDTLAT